MDTACNSHDAHDSDYCRIDWNESGLDLFQHDADDRQDYDHDIQLIPPASAPAIRINLIHLIQFDSVQRQSSNRNVFYCKSEALF